MRELIVGDFKNENKWVSFETYTQLWGSKICLSVDFPDNTDHNEYLARYISSINEYLVWLEANRTKLENYLIEKEFIPLAENWASSAEEAEDEEQECYIMEDGQKVFIPISEESFCKSLIPTSVNLSYEEETELPSVDMYLRCEPDYFSYHAVNIGIDESRNFRYANLEG